MGRLDTLFELYSIGRRFRNSLKKENSDTMLTVTILRSLADTSLSISHLGQLVGMKPSSMSEKVHELETLGFVERKVSTDERESLVSMTPRGEAEVMCILTPMKEKCERVFHNLTDAQMQTLVSYLNMITI